MKTETRAIEIRLAEDPSRNGPGELRGVLIEIRTNALRRPGGEYSQAGALHWPISPDGQGVRDFARATQPASARSCALLPTVEGSRGPGGNPLAGYPKRGRDAALMVRNGTFRGLSVEFIAERESQVAGVREITRARLIGAGLVDDPSYSGASVSVRHKAASSNDEDLMRLL